jgi:hypothetical protein
MLTAMTDTDVQSKLAEYEGIVRLLTAKLEELAAENTRLRSEKSDALSVCKEVYSDPNASPALRLKAAGLALPHEVPRLESVPPPLDLVATEVEPLSVVVERQRARMNRILALPLEERERMIRGVVRDGNGSDDDTAG